MKYSGIVVVLTSSLLLSTPAWPDGRSPSLDDVPRELHKVYKASTKDKKRPEAYLTMARIFEHPLREYRLAIDFYDQAVEAARLRPEKAAEILAESTAGRRRAASAWLESIEVPTVLEMTADPGTPYYDAPSAGSGTRAGVKVPKPAFYEVVEFRSGFCRTKVRQGAVVKDGWFRLKDIETFRVSSAPPLSPGEAFAAYEAFPAEFRSQSNAAMIEQKMDERLFEHARDSASLPEYERYLSRFPEGRHRDEILGFVEKSRFTLAMASNDVERLEAFLEAYPSGQYADGARQKIETLRFDECQTRSGCSAYLEAYPQGRHVRAAHDKIEALDFESLKTSGDLDALREFVEDHPQSRWLDDARNEIERQLFTPFREQHTIESYRAFIQAHPRNRYIAEAQKQIDSIEYAPFEARDEIEGFLTFLDDYPTNRHRADAKRRIDDLQFEPYERRSSIRDYRRFLELFPKNRHASKARRAITRLEVAHVEEQVEAVERENRGLGNRADIRFVRFENGTLVVSLEEPSTAGQALRFLVGGVDDVVETRRRFNAWKQSVVARLHTINGVDRVVVQHH